MEIEKQQNGKTLTIALSGKLDSLTSSAFENEINAISSEITDLILDFKLLEYTSSAGLRVILKAQKLMNGQGSMKLVNVSDDVMDVLDITGFLDILTVE